MSELHLIRHCSPTLAGLKTGNVFSCSVVDPAELTSILREFNLRLKKKGLRLLPIRYKDGRALIYVYRPARLARDLSEAQTRAVLDSFGYCTKAPMRCVKRLIERLEKSEEFPHEIGFFLGYPPEDVCGFIRDPGACKCVGHWKVYGDAEKARKTFAKYKKCSDVYARHWAMGKPLERLVVSV